VVNCGLDGRQTFAAARSMTVGAWWLIAYLALINTLIGYALWFVVIRETEINVTVLTVFIQPVVGVLIATLALKETLRWGQLWGSLAIVSGLVIALSRQIKIRASLGALEREIDKSVSASWPLPPAWKAEGRGGSFTRRRQSGTMIAMSPYKEFTARLKLLISKNPHLITTTLSNIFTMRLIGNKTHGDLAEIAIAEFINQFMYDFKSVHVGKDLYRAKEREEDIKIINEITKAEFPVSLKAYGDGPLQLSTDKHFQMFPKLKSLGMLIEGDALAQVGPTLFSPSSAA